MRGRLRKFRHLIVRSAVGGAELAALSYRQDRWFVEEARKRFLPSDYALALHISQQLDVNSWFTRPQ